MIQIGFDGFGQPERNISIEPFGKYNRVVEPK